MQCSSYITKRVSSRVPLLEPEESQKVLKEARSSHDYAQLCLRDVYLQILYGLLVDEVFSQIYSIINISSMLINFTYIKIWRYYQYNVLIVSRTAPLMLLYCYCKNNIIDC